MRRATLTAIGVAVGTAIAALSLVVDEEAGDMLRGLLRVFQPWLLLPLVAVAAVAATGVRLSGGMRMPAAVRSLHRRVADAPAGLALPLIVGGAAAFRITLSAPSSLPTVFGDELIYADLAKSFANDGTLTLRGVEDLGHSILYPALISPAYAFADDGVSAYREIQVLNAVLIALAAVPAYYLARRVASHGWSLAVALLSVFVPETAYSALVMTESLFYPVFVATALALSLTLERPALARQLLTVALLLVLVAIRPQALAFVPAIVTAVFVDGVRTSRLRARLTAFWPTWTALTVVALLALVASQVGAAAPTGAYGPLLRTYDPLDVVRWAAWNVAGYELALGVVALAALPLAFLRLLRRDASTAEGSVGATVLGVVFWLLLSVAVLSASPYGLDVLHQRSLFFVTPLVLVCFVYWLAEGLPRPLYPTLAVAGLSVGLVLTLPSRLFLSAAFVDSPTNVLWTGLREQIGDVPVGWLVVGAGILGTVVFLSARTAVLPLLCLAVTMLFVTANFTWEGTITREDSNALGWIDRALPGGADATVVHVALDSARCPHAGPSYQGAAVAWTEFFNKAVSRVYGVLGQVGSDGLTTPLLTIRPDGTLRGADGVVSPTYAVFDSRVRIVGTELARLDLHEFPGFDTTRPGSLTLWRPEQPLRLVFPGPLRGGRPDKLACPEAAQ